LGGSESAVINLALTFPKNYNIYITGNVEEENIDNIYFVSSDNLNKLFDSTPFYYVIVSRYIDFYEKYVSASYYKSLIWAHDIRLLNYGVDLDVNEILDKWNEKISYCICQTEWHQNLFSKLYPSLTTKLTNINNGISIEKFVFEPFKILNRFIYTSCTERGLNKLLDLWPKITQSLPNCELFLCSYNDFPRNDHEVMIQNKIKQHKNVAHLGKLDKNKLYELMSSAEYWLYPTDFPETSCITAMEMLASEVICIYYPVAGLVNTLGQYGISVKEGEEVDVIMKLTNNDKNMLRNNGKKYTESCSWKNRFVSWNNILQTSINSINTNKQKLLFYIDKRFIVTSLIDYFDSLNENYDVSYTSLKDDLTNLKNTIVCFIVFLLDINIVNDFINKNMNSSNSCWFFNTEPLNIKMFLNSCLVLNEKFPNIPFFDYSKTNQIILQNNGLKNVKILEYIPYEKETKYLQHLLVTTNKEYDFGMIGDTDITNLCWRRQHCINSLLANGFKILMINGWKDVRDTQLAKCKCILNIHGQALNYEWPKEEHTTQIFEHIRCNRLLEAGFNILSETSFNLDNDFIKKYPNLLIMDYIEILKLTPPIFFSKNQKEIKEIKEMKEMKEMKEITMDKMVDLIDNTRTDKNTRHSYLDLYQKLLQNKKHTATNILEVGICEGGSIKLWHDYFTNAIIYGLDIMPEKDVWTNIIGKERIKLYLETDAYNDDFFKTTFLSTGQKFDMVLDDGPHTLLSMVKFITLYSQLLKEDGILIVEDIQEYSWLEVLMNVTPEHLKAFIKIYDLRHNKNRYDDIVFTIDLTNNK
jgi:glycosyltransferase involved in cell wall biosynthesis